MTEKIDPVQDDEANAGGDQQEVSVEELKSTVARLEAEAAKNRALAKKAFAERDEYKAKTKVTPDDDIRALNGELEAKNTALLNRAKSADVKSALTAQFTKLGLLPDAFALASKAIDMDQIDWDIEGGVDMTSVTAQVARVKRENGFLFEKNISRTDPKAAADGKGHDANVITRSEFDKLDGFARIAFLKKGKVKD